MKQNLNDQERRHLDQRIAQAEKRTGAQIVLAVIERSDDYPELPWKAFALGAALAGLAVALLDLLPGWSSSFAVLQSVTATLAAGAVCALLCVSVPDFARLFLDANRADMESRQYAESLFLSRELFATSQRTGILLLVSLLEREVVALPDTGLKQRLSQDTLQGIIGRMTAILSTGRVSRALEEGLAALEAVLAPASPVPFGRNELPNTIVEEKGP